MGQDDKQKNENPKAKIALFDLIVTFLMPTLCGKALIVYFGLNYTNYPGEGWGVALLCSIAFTVFMIGRFLWKYRNYEE